MNATPAVSEVQIWSAVPTPLTPDLRIDESSVEKMIQDAMANGITGLFLAGTCGEGPWLRDGDKRCLIRAAVAAGGGKIKIAMQVSDNSVPRILDNIERAREAGAEYAIIAPPATMMNVTPERVAALYTEAIAASSLPVGIYDLGRHRPVAIPEERLKDIYLLPQVQLVKDSSGSPQRRACALEALASKPSLLLFNGDEFHCPEYLRAGYRGLLFGGAAAVAPYLQRMVALFTQGDLEAMDKVNAEMKEVLYGIYGGEAITCWLTGLKYYMVKRGLFSSTTSFLGYPLTEACRDYIDGYVAKQTNDR
jgi:dihydrodipicolinate synthase/N-acetylneuraminate lyase